MSSIPRGPNHDDAAEPPTPGANLPRPSLDQTLVGVAPTLPLAPPVTADASPAEKAPEAAQPIVADKPKAIVATPTIAVSGDASKPKLEEPAEPGRANAPHGLDRAGVDPVLQSTAVASDYLEAARDAALRKASVPRPRRTTPAHVPSQQAPSPTTLHASVSPPPPEPTTTARSGSPPAAPSQSMGTQASVAPPAEAADTDDRARAPSPITPPAHRSAPAQPSVRGFEPVPTVRAPLWEQAPPSVGRPLTLDSGTPAWEPLHPASARHGVNEGQRSRWYGLRWIALAAAVLAAVGFAAFGEQLTRPPEGRVKLAEEAGKPPASIEGPNAAPPEQTMLANHPASAPARTPSVADLPARAASTAAAPASDESAPTPVIAPADAALAEPKSNAVPSSKGKKKPVKRSKTKRKRVAPASEPAPTTSEPAPPSQAAPAEAK
jgi:hypothetical protein